MNMFSIFKQKDLRKKILYTLFMLFIFRVGALIPVPGVDASVMASLVEGSDLLSLYNMLVGGAFSSFTLFALGVSPYITASIIVQLLSFDDVVPHFSELSKSGEVGRKILNRYTKIITVLLATIQAIGITLGFVASTLKDRTPLSITLVVLTLVASSMFLIWVGEKITEKGIGNGTSLIIFFGIISRLPSEIAGLVEGVKDGSINPWVLSIVLFISFLVIVGVVFIQEGIRKIPVQYSTKVIGRKTYGGQESHIPLKINQSGVMPVIFASSILALPQTISLFLSADVQNFVHKYFSPTGEYFWIYLLFEVVLIVCFAYFYTMISFNTKEIADNLKNAGGFINGVRPGKPTQDYLENISSRLTLAGAVFLSVIVVIPSVISNYTSIHLTLTGTSILIVVGVALEVVRQLESNLVVRSYSSIFKK